MFIHTFGFGLYRYAAGGDGLYLCLSALFAFEYAAHVEHQL